MSAVKVEASGNKCKAACCNGQAPGMAPPSQLALKLAQIEHKLDMLIDLCVSPIQRGDTESCSDSDDDMTEQMETIWEDDCD